MEKSNQEIKTITYGAVRHLVNTSEACRFWTDAQKHEFMRQLLAEEMLRQKMSSPLTLKPICELVGGLPFLVEKYQRGYKWTPIQVEKLLTDIDEFVPETHGSFYCLQPLVVCYREDIRCWELIDGQQRLTTIYLILSYLKLTAFELQYRTRDGCSAFLASLPGRKIAANCSWNDFVQSQGSAVDNVDNFHFFQAWQTINLWFINYPGKWQSWADKLLEQTKVIWYSIYSQDGNESAQIFMRINSGKIALTNAELVKALFLKQSNFGDDDIPREEIAREWDRFELELQNDAFWYFLTGSRIEAKSNRIELLFDIRARRPTTKTDDPLYTFNHFDGLPNLEGEWGEIKKVFFCLKDWFDDNETYHLIGFLVAAKIKSVGELLKDGKTYAKREFAQLLVEYIRMAFAKVDLDDLRYPDNNKSIQQVLLLFNIQKCLVGGQSATRFPFDRYITENWSLEHIHAQHSQKLDDKDAANALRGTLKPLLDKAQQEVFDDATAKGKLNTLSELLEALCAEPNKGSTNAKKLIADLRSESFSYFGGGMTDMEVDSIDNLALLDRDTNSALNNAIFPEKRKMIRDFDIKGRFIPAGTKDVFMKYNTLDVTQMSVWSKDDRAAYLNALKETLSPYLPEAQV